MKKITKIILIAAISLVVVGGIMFGAGCLFGGIKYIKSIEYATNDYEDETISTDVYSSVMEVYNKYNQGHGLIEKLIKFTDKLDKASDKVSEKNLDKTAGRHEMKLSKTELGKFDSIDIDITHLDVAFRESKDDKCYIEYNVQSKDNTNPFSYDIKDNILYLKETKGFVATYYNKADIDIDLLGIHIGVGDDFLSKYEKNIDNMKNIVRIYIPSDKKLESINAVMNKGDLFMMNIKSAEFNAGLSEGDFIAEKLECDMISLNLEEGDIIVSNIEAKSKTDIETVEGDIIVSDINIKNANIASEEGDIIFSDLSVSENAEIFSEDGDIIGSDCDISGVLSVATTDGDITVNVGKSCADKINISVVNGDGDSMIAKSFNGQKSRENGYKMYTRKTSEGEGSLNVETEDGDIILN